jgi:hypothetical protein
MSLKRRIKLHSKLRDYNEQLNRIELNTKGVNSNVRRIE